jgi:hypothetical protein
MTHKALVRRLQISCLGLDPVDPLRLLVDDVIEALTQPERTWVGLTDDEVYRIAFELEGEHWRKIADAIEAKLKEKNT